MFEIRTAIRDLVSSWERFCGRAAGRIIDGLHWLCSLTYQVRCYVFVSVCQGAVDTRRHSKMVVFWKACLVARYCSSVKRASDSFIVLLCFSFILLLAVLPLASARGRGILRKWIFRVLSRDSNPCGKPPPGGILLFFSALARGDHFGLWIFTVLSRDSNP